MKRCRPYALFIVFAFATITVASERIQPFARTHRYEDNWARELTLSDNDPHFTSDYADLAVSRYLRSKKPKSHKKHKISRKNKSKEQSEKLKNEVRELKKKLKKYKRKLKKKEKKAKKEKLSKSKVDTEVEKKEDKVENIEKAEMAEAAVETSTPEKTNAGDEKQNKKAFRALVLASMLGDNDPKLSPILSAAKQNADLSLQQQQQSPLAPQLALPGLQMTPPPQTPAQAFGLQAMAPPQTSPSMSPSDLQNLMIKNLTLKDCDKIAQRKLTVEKYQKLVTSLDGLNPEEKKQRYLYDIFAFIPSLLTDVTGMLNNLSTSMTSLMMSPTNAKTVSGLALGTALGLKANKNSKFLLQKSKLHREIDTYTNINTLLDDQKANVARTTDAIIELTLRTKSITNNLTYRFNKKIEIFNVAPF